MDTTSDVVDGSVSSIAALLANKGPDGRVSLREAINTFIAMGTAMFTTIGAMAELEA